MSIKQRRALVTGGAGGIGSAVAARLAATGASVVIADIDGERLNAVAADLAGTDADVEAVEVDVSDASLQKLTQRVGRAQRVDARKEEAVLFTLALLIGGLFWGIWRGLMEAPVGSRGEVEPWMKTLEEESSSENEEALR